MNTELVYSFTILFAAVIAAICATNLLMKRFTKKKPVEVVEVKKPTLE